MKNKKGAKEIDPYVREFREKCNTINRCKWKKNLLPLIRVDLGVTSPIALIDSGSSRTLISQELADILAKHHVVKRHQPVNIKCATADKRKININLSITVKVKIKNLTWMFTMLVCKELGPDLILGADFISKTGMILDIYEQKYYFRFDRTRKYRFDSNKKKKMCIRDSSKNT